MTKELVWQWLDSPEFPRSAFERFFADWEVVFHLEDGVPAGAALLKGHEVHFVAAPEWRGRLFKRDNTRAFFAQLLRKCDGVLSTRLLHASTADRFIRRLGFKHTWSDDRFDYFETYSAPFGRTKT